MGIEGIPQKRVENVDKAYEMAKVGDPFRTDAAKRRSIFDANSPIDIEWGKRTSDASDAVAEGNEDRAGQVFDLKQKYPHLSEVEIDFIQWKLNKEKINEEEVSKLFYEKFGKDFRKE